MIKILRDAQDDNAILRLWAYKIAPVRQCLNDGWKTVGTQKQGANCALFFVRICVAHPSKHMLPTIDRDIGPRQKRRFIRRKIRTQSGDLFRLAQSPYRNLRQDF